MAVSRSKDNKRQFATDQFNKLVKMGFSRKIAGVIMRTARPRLAVKCGEVLLNVKRLARLHTKEGMRKRDGTEPHNNQGAEIVVTLLLIPKIEYRLTSGELFDFEKTKSTWEELEIDAPGFNMSQKEEQLMKAMFEALNLADVPKNDHRQVLKGMLAVLEQPVS